MVKHHGDDDDGDDDDDDDDGDGDGDGDHDGDGVHEDGGMIPMMLVMLVKKAMLFTSTNMHTHTRLSNNHSTIFAPQTFPHDDWLFLPAVAA